MNGKLIDKIGLGTWKSSETDVKKAVEAAISCGYRHIDCAWEYGNEEFVGEAISNKIKDGTVARNQLFVTSKLWNDHHEPQHVRKYFLQSLGRLKLEYLDLYLMHFPTGYKVEKKEDGDDIYSDVDYMVTWKEMEKLVGEGLVRSIGVSNFNSHQLARVLEEGEVVPVVNQIEVHPYLTNHDLVDFCRQNKVVVTAFSPFASPDRSWAPKDEKRLLEDPKLAEVAGEMKVTPAQTVLAYLLKRGLVVIPKSATPSRIKSNYEALDIEISEKHFNQVDALNKNFRALALEYDLPHKYYPWKNEYKED